MAEKDWSGKIQKVYINDGEGILSMVRYVYNSSGNFSHHQRLYYLYDSLGSVSLVTGENGMPLQEYYYTPYGSTSNVAYDAANNLRFIGRYGGYKDDDIGLTYFWHRWYDEGDGRWVSRDPISCVMDINLYRTVLNTPVKIIDPHGLQAVIPSAELQPPDSNYGKSKGILDYGNWCGENWTGGHNKMWGRGPGDYTDWYSIPSVDDLDQCCKDHDLCLTGNDLRRIREGRAGKTRGCPDDIEERDKCNKGLKDCVNNAGKKGYGIIYGGIIGIIPRNFWP